MKAEIISTGTELLLGEIADANAPYLASQLSQLGIDLYWMSTVGDNLGRMVEVFERAWRRSDLIISTGGLGPTPGDITRDAIARLLAEEMTVERAEEDRLRYFFSSRGLEMPKSNLKQAMRIPSALFLSNPSGTAPGWWVEKEGRIIVTLPGPPSELRVVWDSAVLPNLKKRLGSEVIVSRVLKSFGVSEAKIGEILANLVARANPTVASYAKFDGIHLRITAKARDEAAARGLIAIAETEIRTIMGDSIWGEDSDTLEAVVARLLTKQGKTVSVMESCTGGLLSAGLTSTPGSSAFFLGSVVSYSNEVKVSHGVPRETIEHHGAVSEETAAAMAKAIRERMGSDLGIGITGVAGPGPTEGKPQGTVFIAIDDGLSPRVISRTLPGNRQGIRDRASSCALFELRKLMLNR